jgi:hypothetical protein
MNKIRMASLAFAVASVGIIGLVGCGEGDFVANAVNEANKSNIQRVANCYQMFQMNTPGYKGPKDLDEFKAFLSDPSRKKNLEMMGVDAANIGALFVSDRDNEEIKIRFGVPGSSRGSNDPVAFETTGVEGVRLVGFTSSHVKEVSDQAEYDSMFEGKYVADDIVNRDGGSAPQNATDVGKGTGAGAAPGK